MTMTTTMSGLYYKYSNGALLLCVTKLVDKDANQTTKVKNNKPSKTILIKREAIKKSDN